MADRDPKYDFFIVYASPDRDTAARLHKMLGERHSVFWDGDLQLGDDFDTALLSAIRAAATTIVLVSENSEESYYQREEIRLGLQLARKHPKQHRVVPVFLGALGSGSRDIPYGLGLKQGIDIESPGDLSNVVDRLTGKMVARIRVDPPVPLRDLVNQLECVLIDRERAQGDEETLAELAAHKDDLVDRIRPRARFEKGGIVAGTRLVRPFGVGNFGSVWLAEPVGGGELVATKLFHLDNLAEELMLWRFRRSIRAMQRLQEGRRKAENVVRIHRADESTLAFSMEYMRGGNLEDVDKLGWTTDRKVQAMLDVCRAVGHAHQAGVIHRDVKPANVVLSANHKPYLTDFDIADVRFLTTQSMHKGGLGTPVFAAPEQIKQSSDADERSDVYSLGRLLHFLLLERSPGLHVEREPSLSNISGEPTGLVDVVWKATQFKPGDRYQNVDDMVVALEASQTGAAAFRARVGKAKRWARRNIALLAIAVGIFGFAVYQNVQAEMQARLRRTAEQSKIRAEDEHRKAEDARVAEAKARKKAEELGERLALALEDLERIQAQKNTNREEVSRLEANANKLTLQMAAPATSAANRSKFEADLAENEQKLKVAKAAQATLDAEITTLESELEAAKGSIRRGPSNRRDVSRSGRRSGNLPRVIPGKPIVSGALDREIIRRKIRHHRASYQYCYEKELNRKRDLNGKIKVKFTIAGTGHVIAAKLMETTMNNRRVESCLIKCIKGWVFPEPTGGGIVIVTYPFIFKPS